MTQATDATARALAPWRTAYWERPVARATCAAMAEKYAALAALEAMPPGAGQDAALREAATRWPGCLRESQLAGPARCRSRRELAEAGRAAAELPRSAWRAQAAEAVPLWADLHALLADQLAWRRAHTGGDLAAFVDSLPAEARARWPDAALLARVAGDRLRPRLAYAWLAAQSGLTLPTLNFALFGRAGSWDARAGDPEVPGAGGSPG